MDPDKSSQYRCLETNNIPRPEEKNHQENITSKIT